MREDLNSYGNTAVAAELDTGRVAAIDLATAAADRGKGKAALLVGRTSGTVLRL